MAQARAFRFFWVIFLAALVSSVFVACGSPESSQAEASSAETAAPTAPAVAGYLAGSPEPDWELVWSDEFDYTGAPDPARWDYDVGGHGWGNNELQYYTEGENARVADGVLTIEARRAEDPAAYAGREYTSTRLVSRQKGDWLYGKIEVRAKLPMGRGTWPAIWMLPTDWSYGNWPVSGEIDIMEHVGYEPGTVHASVHTDRYNHTKGTQISAQIQVPDAGEQFHTYSVEWFADGMRFFMDGREYHRFSPHVWVLEPSFREWPFDKRFHLLLNIAVGGNWGGVRGVAEDIWPQRMEVDYVRVYQDAAR